MNCDRCGVELESLNIWRLKLTNIGDLKLVWLCEGCYDYYQENPPRIICIDSDSSTSSKKKEEDE